MLWLKWMFRQLGKILKLKAQLKKMYQNSLLRFFVRLIDWLGMIFLFSAFTGVEDGTFMSGSAAYEKTGYRR